MIPQDQIIEWAREVDAHRYTNRHFPEQPAFAFNIERLTAFANLVAQYQKEQDALACKHVAANPSSLWQEPGCWEHAAENCAAAIRGQE